MRRNFTNKDINRIRVSTESLKQLAQLYGTGKSTIADIKAGRTYKHVPTPKTLTRFPNYVIFPDGEVVSKTTCAAIAPRYNSVRLYDKSLRRVRVPVTKLINEAFGRG